MDSEFVKEQNSKRLHDVWLAAYNAAVSAAQFTYATSQESVRSFAELHKEALGHAENAVKQYREHFKNLISGSK